jgi:hypothetical protein
MRHVVYESWIAVSVSDLSKYDVSKLRTVLIIQHNFVFSLIWNRLFYIYIKLCVISRFTVQKANAVQAWNIDHPEKLVGT